MAYRVKLFKEIKTVNELIIAVRKALRLTQEDFGLRLGYAQRTISTWETGAQMSRELETGIMIGLMAGRLKLPVESILASEIEIDKPDREIESKNETDYNAD